MNKRVSLARCFVEAVKNFLGNHKATNYVELVEGMRSKLHALGCDISIKLHYQYKTDTYYSKKTDQNVCWPVLSIL